MFRPGRLLVLIQSVLGGSRLEGADETPFVPRGASCGVIRRTIDEYCAMGYCQCGLNGSASGLFTHLPHCFVA